MRRVIGLISLVPRDDGVIALGHVIDHEPMILVRRRKERIGQHEHDRAHVGVNVAEDLDGAGLAKRPGVRRAPGIAAQVEAVGPAAPESEKTLW